QLGVRADPAVPVPLAEEMVDAAVAYVERRCVARVQLAHPLREPAVADTKDEVVVVAHEGVGDDPPAVLRGNAVEVAAERLPIEVVLEDGALVVAPRDDVVIPGALVAQLYRHAASVRSEEHTSELQSQSNLVCRLL